ncbi:MAG: PAS domain-containing protein, partial [Chloroflexota bacterium]|nr:PAS domain-containing protein [Chloroflexota bacterium]
MKREHEAKQRQRVAESGTVETKYERAEGAIVESKIWLPVACAFVLLCAFVWLNEILDLPHLLLGALRTPINWRESISETIVIAIVGFIVMSKLIRDVIKRRRMEEALRESEEKFRTVADFTYAWEYWIDPDGSYVYISPSCERITGYRASEFLQDANLLRTIIHPDGWETFANHRHEVLEAGGVLPIDFRIVTLSGDERWIGHVCQPIYSSDGRCLGLRGSNRDITERVRAEEALRQYA